MSKHDQTIERCKAKKSRLESQGAGIVERLKSLDSRIAAAEQAKVDEAATAAKAEADAKAKEAASVPA